MQYNDNETIKEIIKDQSKIGILNLQRGIISKKWTEAQKNYNCQDQDFAFPTTQWTALLIEIIWEAVKIKWKLINENLHETTKALDSEKIKQLKEKASHLYQRTKHKVTPTDTFLFRNSIDSIKNLPSNKIINWIS